jgi:type IV pilus assembly protein PilM
MRMAKKATTLFIRDTSINLLVMKGEQVEKWASSPLEPGLVNQGLIVDEEQVADKVKQIFRETGASTNKVVTALSGDDSLYRIITMPELPEAVFSEAVRREVKRTIPTPLEEIYYSYQRLPSLMKGESRIFLVTFPRNLADALVRTLRRAGVKPYIMDLAPLALSRIPDEPRSIIVNARLDHLDVAVIADRLPQVIRRLSLPGETESLEDRLPLIAEEFNRTVAFYNSSHVENPVDATVPVFVCGDLVEEPETWQAAVGGAGYQVSALSSSMEPPEGFNPSEFMVNIGLAYKELLEDREGANFSIVNFNALPEAYVPPSFSMVRVLLPIVTVIGIGLVVLMVILFLTNRASIESLQSDVLSAETSVTQQQQAINNLNSEIGPAATRADALSAQLTAMERDRAMFHEDVDLIEKLAGEQVILNNINHSGSSVAVTGTASNEDAIFRYAENLRALTGAVTEELTFSQVWITSLTGSDGAIAFQFSLTK